MAVGIHGLRVILCLNKADLVDPDAVEQWIAVYEPVVDEIIVTSAQTGRGIERNSPRRCEAISARWRARREREVRAAECGISRL